MRRTSLPGAELVEAGIRDLRAGNESDAAWLVLIGAPRLEQLGINVPAPPTAWLAAPADLSPEHRLYTRLSCRHGNDAHSKYNALIRALVSFERARACVT